MTTAITTSEWQTELDRFADALEAARLERPMYHGLTTTELAERLRWTRNKTLRYLHEMDRGGHLITHREFRHSIDGILRPVTSYSFRARTDADATPTDER